LLAEWASTDEGHRRRGNTRGNDRSRLIASLCLASARHAPLFLLRVICKLHFDDKSRTARRLVRLNETLARPEGIAALAGNAMPRLGDPIATVYAGHQFGNLVPQLGDGLPWLTFGQRQ
jgi:uncharacterized protein YdiU (UPF0061 family)